MILDLHLGLRPYRPTDYAFFAGLFENRRAMGHVGGPLPAEGHKALFQEILAPSGGRVVEAWLLEMQHGSIGHAALLSLESAHTLEVSVILHPQSWGRGLGTRAFRALVHKASQRPVQYLIATVDLDNHASIRALRKAGFGNLRIRNDEEGEYAELRLSL